MAQALSIIGEAGLGGFQYESALKAYTNASYKSDKLRWTIAPTPEFSPSDFRVFLAYAAREGFIDAGDQTKSIARGEYHVDGVRIELTLSGWRHIERYDVPLLHQWAKNIRDNFPIYVLSVVTSLLIGWAFGIGSDA